MPREAISIKNSLARFLGSFPVVPWPLGTGAVPEAVAALSFLTHLHVSQNAITGSLPEAFSYLLAMTSLQAGGSLPFKLRQGPFRTKITTLSFLSLLFSISLVTFFKQGISLVILAFSLSFRQGEKILDKFEGFP